MTDEQTIISAVIDRLKLIKTDDGYLTDLGDLVEDWNDETIPSGTPSYVEVRDPETNFLKPGDQGFLVKAHKQKMTLEISAQFEKQKIPVGRNAVKDIYKMIGINKWWFWDNHQVIFRPVKHVKDVVKEDRTYIGVKVILEAEFITHEWGVEEEV